MIFLFFWLFALAASLIILVTASNWIIEAAHKISLRAGLPANEAGMVAVALGAALPEIAVGIAAVQQGIAEAAPALAIGSVITNILLVAGLGALVSRAVAIKEEAAGSDAVFFSIAVAVFFLAASDGAINVIEGAVFLAGVAIYAGYVLASRNIRPLTSESLITPDLIKSARESKIFAIISSRIERILPRLNVDNPSRLQPSDAAFLFAGAVGLVVGAHYAVLSMSVVAGLLHLSVAVAAMTLMALALALPELYIALAAARQRQFEAALGNIFGSCIFNLLLLCGMAAMFGALPLDSLSLAVGLPFLLAASLFLVVASRSRRINAGEGAMFLLVYLLFLAKLFNLF